MVYELRMRILSRQDSASRVASAISSDYLPSTFSKSRLHPHKPRLLSVRRRVDFLHRAGFFGTAKAFVLQTKYTSAARRAAVSTQYAVDSSAEQDTYYMHAALDEAKQAGERDEVPVGAIIVLNHEIIARAQNKVEGSLDPTAHAEMLCIREAAARVEGWRLLDATLYVTLEPCPMCAGAILQARVGTLVYGSSNPLLGADGSWVSLFPRREHSSASLTRAHPFHPDIKVRRGVLSDECAELMRTFFQGKRAKSRACCQDSFLT